MARLDLKCGCGHTFFVGTSGVSPGKAVPCPACDEPVSLPGAPAPSPRPAPAKTVPPAAPAAAGRPAARAGGRPPLLLLGGVAAGVLAVLGAVLAFSLRAPEVDPVRQAELELAARKKAFEQLAAQGGPAAAAPQANPPAAPAKAAPGTAPARPLPAPPASRTPAPATAAPAPAGLAVLELPAELLGRIRTEVLALPGYYLALVLSPAERARAEAIAQAGRGPTLDAQFLQSILAGEKLRAVREEQAALAALESTLDRDVLANLPVDRVTLDEGRTLDCRILDDSGDVVKISRVQTLGVGGQMPIPRTRITRLEKGKGIGTEFSARWEASRTGPPGPLADLMAWCREHSLGGPAKLVACAILRQDPSHPLARAEAGLPPDPVKRAEEIARGGVIVYQGKNWPAPELKEKLLKEGYAIQGGMWFSKKEKVISMPNLFKYERQAEQSVKIEGTAPLCHEFEVTFHPTTDSTTGAYVDQNDSKEIRRFYAPELKVHATGILPNGVSLPPRTADMDIRSMIEEGDVAAGAPMKAEVLLTIPVGAPILEASLMTTAEVKPGGSVTVFLVTTMGPDQIRTRLYACEGRDSTSRPLPTELVRGLAELNLAIVIEQTASYTLKVDRARVKSPTYKGRFLITPGIEAMHVRQLPEYKAMLFPSIHSAPEVLRLRLQVGEPAPQLDRLFAGNPELLH